MSHSHFDSVLSQYEDMRGRFGRTRPLFPTLIWLVVALISSFVAITFLYWAASGGDSLLFSAAQSASLTMTMGGLLLVSWNSVASVQLSEEIRLCRDLITLGEEQAEAARVRDDQARDSGERVAHLQRRENERQRAGKAIEGAERWLANLAEVQEFARSSSRIGVIVSVVGLFTTPLANFLQ